VELKSLWEKLCIAIASRELVIHLTSEDEWRKRALGFRARLSG